MSGKFNFPNRNEKNGDNVKTSSQKETIPICISGNTIRNAPSTNEPQENFRIATSLLGGLYNEPLNARAYQTQPAPPSKIILRKYGSKTSRAHTQPALPGGNIDVLLIRVLLPTSKCGIPESSARHPKRRSAERRIYATFCTVFRVPGGCGGLMKASRPLI